MYGMCHHSAWMFVCPSTLCNKKQWNSHFTLGGGIREGVSDCLVKGQKGYQTKGHWQVHYKKAHGFLSHKDTSMLSTVA